MPSQVLVQPYRIPRPSTIALELGAQETVSSKHAPCRLQDFLRKHSPEVYGGCTYTSLEISGELSRRQRHRLVEAGHLPPRFTVRRTNALQSEAWGRPSDSFTYVIMCEVRCCPETATIRLELQDQLRHERRMIM